MGTNIIQAIVDNLIRQSAEKEDILAGRFEETSVWLANELQLIRKMLILKKPRAIGADAATAASGSALQSSTSSGGTSIMMQQGTMQSLSSMPITMTSASCAPAPAPAIYNQQSTSIHIPSLISSSSSSSSLGGLCDESSGKRRAPEAAAVVTTFSPG